MINLIAMHIQRFFAYLSAFTAGMLVLICGGNFLVMFVGWESIGVASYLLINFYFTRIQANKAAILAFTMNRGGDMLMSIGFFAIFSIFGSLNYSEIFSLVPFINETTITLISLFLLGGALAKSANIPLHSWLPGSMEAPTPVSALLHAATLVTAGIYLLIRVSPILEYSSTALLVITIIGSTTAFIAATSGLLANDLKRIIAFSTISQLGYFLLLILLVFLLYYNFPTHSSSLILIFIFILKIREEIDLYITIYNKTIQPPLLCNQRIGKHVKPFKLNLKKQPSFLL
jgi:NADH-ubiquinone oxidoreductase chain 5